MPVVAYLLVHRGCRRMNTPTAGDHKKDIFIFEILLLSGRRIMTPTAGDHKGPLPYGYNARACCEDSCAGDSVVKAPLVQ